MWAGIRWYNAAFQPHLNWCKMRVCGPGLDTNLLNKNQWIVHNSAFLHGCQCCNMSMWPMYVRCMLPIDPQAKIVENQLVCEAFPGFRLEFRLRVDRRFCPFQNWQSLVFPGQECEFWLQAMMPKDGRWRCVKSGHVVISWVAMRFLHFPLLTTRSPTATKGRFGWHRKDNKTTIFAAQNCKFRARM